MFTRKPTIFELLTDYSSHHLATLNNILYSELSDLKLQITEGRDSYIYFEGFELMDADLAKMIDMRRHLFLEPSVVMAGFRHDYYGTVQNLYYNFCILWDKKCQQSRVDKEMDERFQLIDNTLKKILDFVRSAPLEIDSLETCFSLNEIIEGCTMQLRVQLRNHQVRLKIDENNDDVKIIGRPMCIGYVYQAVILNSIESLAESGLTNREIHILTKFVNGKVTIAISDNGPGIADNKIELVFELGYSTKTKNGGLGLFVVSKIVKKELNGKCKIFNTNPGTKFVLTFKPRLCGN